MDEIKWSNFSKDDVDIFMEHGIYFPTRTIYMGSNSTTEDEEGNGYEMTEKAIKALHILDTQAPKGDKSINIIMNNPGGNWYHGMAVYDAIKNCINHVTVKICGHGMSMGAVILQAADYRMMCKNSRIMLHYGTNDFSGHTKDYQKWAAEYKKCDEFAENTFLEKIKQKIPNMTKKKIKEILNFDSVFDSEKSLEYGLVDEIIVEKVIE